MNNNESIWVLADDRIGNTNQSLGVAAALGLDFRVINISYNSLIRLPNFIIRASTIGISKESLYSIKEPWPKLLITAGRRSSNLARYIKKKSGGKTLIVQIMYPGKSAEKEFDLIVVPNHDNVADKNNIIKITGAPHRLTKARLEEEKNKWQNCFAHLPRPYTVLLVGGATKNRPFTIEMAEDLAQMSNRLAEKGSLLITTSRRTGKEQTQALLAKISVPANVYNWNAKTENPYFGYLALADQIVATGDSVSMCSEACFVGVPVYIYAPKNAVAPKHQRLHQELCQKAYAQMLSSSISANFKKEPCPNPANIIAAKIKELLIAKGVNLDLLKKHD